MGSLEKVVKLACKPKAAPPKSKYLQPIIAATWNEDGAVHDLCRALQPRFREPNAIVVFKALIVLHTMMREGSTDNVLSYLSSSEILHLRNVSAGQWEGYHPPQNMQHYAIFLDSRIRAYRELKHDAVSVQSEHQRDMRISKGLDADDRPKRDDPGLKRGKTLAGRKLRIMSVEKGLLRETRAVQKQIDALVECRFYLDNLEDPLAVSALRMLVQDLLILFSAANEGVINVLEHYFEMSKVDAETALSLYRHFCKQCEKVVEYLGVAKKLQNILNVQVPNMKHAPLSLAGALKEYLDDPNFEQNRIEYKLQKESAEKNGKAPIVKKTAEADKPSASSTASQSAASTSNASAPANAAPVPQNVSDFFESIEQAQHPMFGPSPITANIPQPFNPFAMQAQATGAFGAAPFGQQPFAQPTMQQQQPFLQPQATGFNPFAAQMQQPQIAIQSFGNNPFPQTQPQLRPQPTGFLQPQVTGGNPFRQSMLMPQSTGMLFGGMQSQATGAFNPGPFGPSQPPAMMQQPMSTGAALFNAPPMSAASSTSTMSTFSAPNPFPQFNQAPAIGSSNSTPSNSFGSSLFGGGTNNNMAPPQRPGSAPILAKAPATSSSPPPQPVKTHQTGSRNPFGPVVTPAPPVPKVPTMADLLGGAANSTEPHKMSFAAFEAREKALAQQQQGQNGASGATSQPSSVMASVASSFNLGGTNSPSSPLLPQATASTSSGFSDSIFSSLSMQPTGATATSSNSTPAFSGPGFGSGGLAPQATGFGGVKPFKPSSSFGATLLETIPGSSPTTPAVTGNPTNGLTSAFGALNVGSTPATTAGSGPSSTLTGFGSSLPSFSANGTLGSSSTTSALNLQSTGAPDFASKSMLGTGLRPQMTGGLNGQANPFRATMFGSGPGAGMGVSGSLMPQSTGAALFGGGAMGGTAFGPQGSAPFGGSAFGNAGATGGGLSGQQQGQQQQGTASLI